MAAALIPVETYVEIDSTNAEALRRIARGDHGPRWLRADIQTAGRGRSGRAWSSEHGNFAASLILPLSCPPARAAQLSLVIGVALHDAVCTVAPVSATALHLKWPNDLLLDGAKLSGTLIESTATADGLVAVIGIGVNLAHAPANLDRAVTHLAAHGARVTPTAFLDALSPAIQRACATWCDGDGFADVRAAWLARALPAGTVMSVTAGEAKVAGRFDDLTTDGALRLRLDDGGERVFTFGDVAVM
jgi:BirA family biotin operon repressor/biotin-[acetyl-CoA-carboxylase] ligase